MDKLKHSRLLIAGLIFYVLIQIGASTDIINGYFMVIINRSLIFVILAISLNLINGITGQFSLGHMGFAAVGAYVSGTLTTLVLQLSPNTMGNGLLFALCIIVGGLGAAVVGFLIGFPSLRLKGDYLAIVTLGFGEVIRTILNNISYVGGPRGLLGIPKFSNFFTIFMFTFFTIVLLRNLVVSSHGRAMLSIRENELASELIGVDTTRYKVLGFVIGAFFAGIGGGLLAHLLQIAHPTQYRLLRFGPDPDHGLRGRHGLPHRLGVGGLLPDLPHRGSAGGHRLAARHRGDPHRHRVDHGDLRHPPHLHHAVQDRGTHGHAGIQSPHH